MRSVNRAWAAFLLLSLLSVAANAETTIDDAALSALQSVVASQSEEQKARYSYRNPVETLRFFEVIPGMTVIEGLPGSGWYTRILVAYLGDEGTLIAAHHADEAWQALRPTRDLDWEAERIENTRTWTQRTAGGIAAGTGITLNSYQFSKMPQVFNGTVDRVLFFRMLHNLQELGDEYVTAAIAESYRALKPGGIVGVVQHRAPETSSDSWANGDAGYLKPSRVIAAFRAAGFLLIDESELNANPHDQPTEADVVWRLPPTLRNATEGTP
ncbi:MAG: methyltransferase, partial [Pseudomonadota bacterium]